MRHHRDQPSDRISIQQFVYLIPVLGFFPALWTLYRHQGTPQERATCRLVVTLAFSWLAGNLLLRGGASLAEIPELPVLLTSSVLTTTYFLVNFGLMVRLWKDKPLWLPAISPFSEKVMRRYLGDNPPNS
ncbi:MULTISPECIES: hypothetical protein [Arthrospira]|uniref:DUF4870 domain-containing protein n=1 Tax=Limnospira platensis NIES-46 TaxID=1236695 RepID=A0A5M3T2H6_LIMPL|nr:MULTISPECIES: hypothetical protein [Arthrospira]AMW31045.1 hypothetical protein AP285_27110 [Arthrospira platensis YZ]KDR54827.1 hypothetical protein APPUASWS_026890 [Arthrospira platensis str. Paraca]MBD2670460.1 hypothetical protein [Arthrospira platensis FACHB-439]MBD2711220.1 hypothetical protein [Arthrospira platensis FACHB-835]MDF2208439.1 hypothetical protein [Arthrospira platensis NCB002]MDT9182878.1 hypothetical protein [Limnospira sp. PMC 289.06]MDT9311450.1 hypothetical protein